MYQMKPHNGKEPAMSMIRRRSGRSPFDFGSIRELMDAMNEPFTQFGELKPFEQEGILPVDVSETDNEYVIRASLPGFKKDDLDIEVHEGVVTINAQHTEEDVEENEKFYRRERRFGSMSRSITLPGIAPDSEPKAELKEGVLTVRVPQSPANKPRKVQIK